MSTVKKHRNEQPDYENGYAGLEISGQDKLSQVLTRFRGIELAIVAIAGIAIYLRDQQFVGVTSIVCIAILGVIASIHRNRDNYGPSSKKATQSEDEPRRARRGQAKARRTEEYYPSR